jgi:hypothetical protein
MALMANRSRTWTTEFYSMTYWKGFAQRSLPPYMDHCCPQTRLIKAQKCASPGPVRTGPYLAYRCINGQLSLVKPTRRPDWCASSLIFHLCGTSRVGRLGNHKLRKCRSQACPPAQLKVLNKALPHNKLSTPSLQNPFL